MTGAQRRESDERNPDDVLFEHFAAIIKGSSREFGEQAARDARRIFLRARATGQAVTFTGYVIRLMQADAAANGWA